MLVDVAMPIAHLLESGWHCHKSEVSGIGGVDLFPRERRRYAGIRFRPHRVGRRHGAVLRVLVVVDEDAVTLFLPPFTGGNGRRPPLDLACQGDRGTADFRERPPGLDPHIHMDAA